MDGNSSYQFKPKAPDNWSVKTYDRNGKKEKMIKLKPWQLEAHLLLRGALFGFLRAFCGSGKTIVARSIAAYKILTTGKRQVFCVPKNEIGNDGFANHFDIEIPGIGGRKKVLHCEKPINFCSARSLSKIDELIRILCKDPVVDDCAGKNRIVSSMQIVITQQCLTLAVRKLKNNPIAFKKFIKNNTFWIDEGHHIKGHDESEEEKSTMNLLGKFVNKVLNSKEEGVELFAMTATPYRGDYSRLFSAKQLDGFVNYSLDFLVHFPTLGIEKVDMELEEYSDIDDVIKRVCYNIGEELSNKHFVFVPPTGRKWRKNQSDVEKLFQAIYQVIMQKTGCDLEKAKSMVLDLVTKSTQSFNDKLLRQEPKGGDDHSSKFTVVVACMKCREGSDWCPSDRIHNTSMEDSPPFIFQTNGRLFRYFPGKKQVKIRYYREKFKTMSVGKREFVSDRVNSILHYMLMDDILNPIMVNVPTFISSKKKKEERDCKRKYTTLEEIFSHQYQEMKRFLLTGIADMDFNEKSVDQIIAQSMQKYLPEKRKFTKGQVSKIKMALKVFLLRCRSGELRTQGIDASFIRKNGFDSVVESKRIGGNMYTSNLTLAELKKFRETAKKISLTEEQKRQICAGIHKIVSENLPEKKRNDQDYLDHFAKTLREFVRFQKKYAGSFGTKYFSPEGLAKLVKKSFDHTSKMIGLFNKHCLKKDMRFDFSEDSQLAGKFVSLRAA